jgi:hypothetical protein
MNKLVGQRSHPLQSTVRVLLQLDAPEPTMLKFWTDLQDRLAPVKPWLLYFRESDPSQAMEAIFRERGLAWQSYVVEALSPSPWMKERWPLWRCRFDRDGSPLCGVH